MNSSFHYHLSKGGRALKHYMPLIGVCLAGVVGFSMYQNDPGFQRAIVFATALSYISWGICHHKIHRDLTIPVILEYGIIALLGVIIVFSFL